MIRTIPKLPALGVSLPKRPRLRVPRRSIRRAARVAVLSSGFTLLVYSALCAVMVWSEPDLVYLSSRPDEEWIDKPSAAIQDITLRTRDGALHGWYLPVKNADAVLLLCHGQAGNLTARGQVLPDFSRLFNAATLVFDYPGYGISEGKPTESGCYAAADAAYEWLVREKGFTPEQIIIYGESLGGGVAIDLASRKPHAALLLVNTFTDLPAVAQRLHRWVPVGLLMTNRFDSESKIAHCRAPVFITHGTADRLIPFEHSLRLFEKMTCPKEHLAREGMDHTDPLSSDSLNQIRDFLVRHGCLPKMSATDAGR